MASILSRCFFSSDARDMSHNNRLPPTPASTPPQDRSPSPSSSSHPPHNEPMTFLTLPTEIRLRIYSFLVVPGRIYFSPLREPDHTSPRYKDWQTTPKPTLTLLRVSRQIQNEAEHEYASQNVFVLPCTFRFHRPSLPHERPLMSLRAWKSVRRISLSFHTGAAAMHEFLPDNDIRYWTRQWVDADGPWLRRRWEALNREYRPRETHNLMTTFCMNNMVDKIRDLYTLLPTQPLLGLEIDVASAFCPMNDHRLVGYVARYITHLALPSTIEVFGAWTTDEMCKFAYEVHRSLLWYRNRHFCLHFRALEENTQTPVRVPPPPALPSMAAHTHFSPNRVLPRPGVVYGGKEAGVYYYEFEGNPGPRTQQVRNENTDCRGAVSKCRVQHDPARRLDTMKADSLVGMLASVYYPEPVVEASEGPGVGVGVNGHDQWGNPMAPMLPVEVPGLVELAGEEVRGQGAIQLGDTVLPLDGLELDEEWR